MEFLIGLLMGWVGGRFINEYRLANRHSIFFIGKLVVTLRLI
ncbi:hypothetical protein MAXJ12_08494 [Mesorhizobium alhagi CCNWXJ12-2]|uniref:Uncharacterized protein n=1 Tax=Mesorhizobium alhagi CCNWXJ12-2 TaxID=1107882 RepID=H0HNH6_9HYPH|nr:hypothetical protein MAXJ12_08494 [Mesorhizobium alhagi CCNWXJ12-2]